MSETVIPSFAQIRRLEGLSASMRDAVARKRKGGLRLHPDELEPLAEAITAAAAFADAARVAEVQASAGDAFEERGKLAPIGRNSIPRSHRGEGFNYVD